MGINAGLVLARCTPRCLFTVAVCGNRILLSYNMSEQEDQLNPVKLRQRVGLTQRQVAQALDVRQSTVSDWERGVTTPNLPPSKLKMMLQIYQCTLDDLIEAFEKTKAARGRDTNSLPEGGDSDVELP